MKNILKIFIVLFLLCLPINAYSKDFSVSVVSDVHLNSDKKDNKMTPSIKKLLEAVNQINSSTSSYAVFLGDNTAGANKHDLVMFSKVINKLKKPYFVLVGNRDVSKAKELSKKEYYKLLNRFSSNRLKELPSYKKVEGLVFVFMSGVNETFPSYKGYYKADELIYLDNLLDKFKDEKVVIFQHFPVVEPKEDESKQTHKKDEYLKVLSRHNNVIAVVSGHYHTESVIEDNGIKHISVGALVDSGEYEQIKFYENKDGSYSINTVIYGVE